MSRALHQERLMTVIRGPHLSEKAHIVAEKNQVVLKVRTDATKKEIQQAVELLFEVQVDSVRKIRSDSSIWPLEACENVRLYSTLEGFQTQSFWNALIN